LDCDFSSEWDLEHGHFQYDDKMTFLELKSLLAGKENAQERLTMEMEKARV